MMDTQQHGMISPTATRRGLATAADIVDDRQEVVRGELVRKASPSFGHGLTQMALGGALAGFLGPGGSPARPGGWWLASEVEVELAPHEVYLPDMAGWRIARMPEPRLDARPVRVTPDWVCEILSPSTADRDLGQKQASHHAARVGHYWVLEPMNRVLTVYRWEETGYRPILATGAGAVVRAEPFDAIEIALGDIFRVPPSAI